jgi:hypothetical protein|tara:strand:- start:4425 stop:4940 length:516 start_codon:yes stop_codon:yes gene_type:complete
MDSRRIKLGLKECIECSETQKYSGHVVYPHKTGGYIQPVSQEQSDNLKKLDRRSTSGGRVAKGVFADNSWDRWLKQYQANIYNKQPTKKLSKKIRKKFSHMNNTTLHQLVVNEFIKYGYYQAVDKVNDLYSKDRITLPQKGKMVTNLSGLQMMTSKEKKFFIKLERNKNAK